MKETKEKDQFPSVELAYPIAVSSYEMALKRLDTMDGRLQTIIAFSVSVFGGFVSFASSSNLAFNSSWFIVAVLLCSFAAGYGIYGRLYGDVKMLKPSNLYEGWLADDKWVFQKDMIFRAGLAFDENMALVTKKWKISVCVTILLVFEVAALTVWILAVRP